MYICINYGNMKIELNEKEIISKYSKEKQSVSQIAADYHVARKRVKEILDKNSVERWGGKGGSKTSDKKYVVTDTNVKKFVPRDGYHYECIAKDGSGFKCKDVDNRGGFLTSYLRKCGIDVPSVYHRNEYYKKTGKYWAEQYFDYVEVKDEEFLTKECPYCGWKTRDIENKSGVFAQHLLKEHNMSVEKYLDEHPEDKEYFKGRVAKIEKVRRLNNPDNYVVCPICGKRMNSITYSHLSFKHKLTMSEFKKLYPDAKIMSDMMMEEVHEVQHLSNLTVSKHRFVSKYEREIQEFLKDNGVDFECNRQVLIGREIDILIPSKRIGIEFDGLRWHSEFYGKKANDYHLRKTVEANEKGYGLIHIFEDEYVNHKEIVFDKLRHILGLNNGLERVYGRSIEVKEIDRTDEVCEFFEKYHIQGKDCSSVYVGGYYNGELVGIMSFKNGYMMSRGWQVSRFAAKTDRIYIGLAGKLFSAFVKKYKPEKVVSFCDRRWTLDGENCLYTKIGFKLTDTLKPNFTYYNNAKDKFKRLHELQFKKKDVMKKHGFPETMTLTEMTRKLGYDRIWDCGLFKYVWTKKGGES